MKEAASISRLLTSAAAVHGLLGPQMVWILWVGMWKVRGRLGGPPTVPPMKGLTKWQLNTIPLSTARNVIHTRYTQAHKLAFLLVHFCLKTHSVNNKEYIWIMNIHKGHIHRQTHKTWKNWEMKPKQGKEVVKSIVQDCH